MSIVISAYKAFYRACIEYDTYLTNSSKTTYDYMILQIISLKKSKKIIQRFKMNIVGTNEMT